jgi:predicted transcriptional regulator
MSKVKVHIGNLDDMGRRFVDAWHRAEKGESVNENNLTFYSLETLLSTLTPKRMALLKTVHRTGKTTIKALAESVGRDYKNVHQDVTALFKAGLLLKEDGGIAAPWDEITASVVL